MPPAPMTTRRLRGLAPLLAAASILTGTACKKPWGGTTLSAQPEPQSANSPVEMQQAEITQPLDGKGEPASLEKSSEGSSKESAAMLDTGAEKEAEGTNGFPRPGSSIGPEEAHRLLSDTVTFNPPAITSSGVPVEAGTPLKVGQELQVKYGGTWWAGSVLGLEQDGKVKIHYFGWASSWDEAKPREELQVDSGAKVRALDTMFVRNGW